jgi:hypothetical protein
MPIVTPKASTRADIPAHRLRYTTVRQYNCFSRRLVEDVMLPLTRKSDGFALVAFGKPLVAQTFRTFNYRNNEADKKTPSAERNEDCWSCGRSP